MSLWSTWLGSVSQSGYPISWSIWSAFSAAFPWVELSIQSVSDTWGKNFCFCFVRIEVLYTPTIMIMTKTCQRPSAAASSHQFFEGRPKVLDHCISLGFALLSKVCLNNFFIISVTIVLIVIFSIYLDVLVSSGKAKSIDGLCRARHPPVSRDQDEDGEAWRWWGHLAGLSVTPVIAEENLKAMSLSSCTKSSSSSLLYYNCHYHHQSYHYEVDK